MKKPTVLRIEGEFTIVRAMELKQALLARPQPLEIDLSGVTEIDTAGVQLLMLAKKEALAARRELHLVAHSPAVIEVFDLLNVGEYFDDLMVMDACAKGKARSSNGP